MPKLNGTPKERFFSFILETTAPVAQDDQTKTGANTPVQVPVLNNDSGLEIALDKVSRPPQKGQAVVSGRYIVYTPNSGFAGQDSFQYRVKDRFGKFATATVKVTVASAPLSAPTIVSPQAGAAVENARPAITGSGVPGAIVEVKDKRTGTLIGQAVVKVDSDWSVTPHVDLSPGEVTLTVTQSKEGKTSDPAERTFTVADQPVQAPEIILPKADSVTPTSVKFEGTAAADKGVTKVKLTEGGKEIRTLTVDAKSGKWWTSNSKLPTLTPGKHTVTATGITADGVESKPATRAFTVRGQAGPTVTKPQADSTQPSKVKFEGTADRKAGVYKVELADKGKKPFATVNVGDNGQWWTSNSKLPTLTPGKHTVTATGITADGRTAPTEVTFTVLADAPAPVITKPADGSNVTGPLVKFEGTVADDAGVAKVRLYDQTAGREIGTYAVNPEGQWWISNSKLPTLASGEHSVTATGILTDGSTTASSTTTFTVK